MSAVATYPPVGDRERDAALARIARRHARYDDSRWSEAGTEVRDVLAYLRRRRAGPPLPAQLATDDAWDELVLSAWVWWDERRRERELLHSALRRGLSLADIGRYLGVTTRQGSRDYLDRLDALLADHHRHATTPRGPATGDGATDPLHAWTTTTRAARGADVHAARAGRAATRRRPSADEWVGNRTALISSVVGALLTATSRLEPDHEPDSPGDLADYLEWLREDHTREVYSPATLATLGLALGELRNRPTVRAVADNHAVRTAIRDADQLRSDFGALR